MEKFISPIKTKKGMSKLSGTMKIEPKGVQTAKIIIDLRERLDIIENHLEKIDEYDSYMHDLITDGRRGINIIEKNIKYFLSLQYEQEILIRNSESLDGRLMT